MRNLVLMIYFGFLTSWVFLAIHDGAKKLFGIMGIISTILFLIFGIAAYLELK